MQLALGEVLGLAGAHDEAVRAFSRARRGVVRPRGGPHASSPRSAWSAARRVARRRRSRPLGRCAGSPTARPRHGPRAELVAEADLLSAGVRYWQGRAPSPGRSAARPLAHAERLRPEGRPAPGSSPAPTRCTTPPWSSSRDGPGSTATSRCGCSRRSATSTTRAGSAPTSPTGSSTRATGTAPSRYYRRVARAGRAHRRRVQRAVAQMNLGELLAQQGRPREAVDACSARASPVSGGLRTPLAEAHAECFLGDALGSPATTRRRPPPSTGRASSSLAAARTSGFSLDELATRRLELAVATRGPDAAADAGRDARGRATRPAASRPDPRALALVRLAAG